MAVTATKSFTGTYDSGDIRSVTIERRGVAVTVDHTSTTVDKLFAKAKLQIAGDEDSECEVEIDAAKLKKAIVDSGIAAMIVAAANAKLGG